jgi:hypothetical protein
LIQEPVEHLGLPVCVFDHEALDQSEKERAFRLGQHRQQLPQNESVKKAEVNMTSVFGPNIEPNAQVGQQGLDIGGAGEENGLSLAPKTLFISI